MTDKTLGSARMPVHVDGSPVSPAAPLPISIDGGVTITGPVSIPGSVEVSNDAGNPFPVSGSAPIGSAPTQPPR